MAFFFPRVVFVWSRDGVYPAGGAQLEAAGGGKAAAAGERPLHAGLWLQAGAAQNGRAAGTKRETLWRGEVMLEQSVDQISDRKTIYNHRFQF